MPAAEKLADDAEENAPLERIRRMRDFRRWVQVNKTHIEKRVLFGTRTQSIKTHWITPKVIDEAWRLLRARRAR